MNAPDIDARLALLGVAVRDVAEGVCDGCKGQDGVMYYDSDCYQYCDNFTVGVMAIERERKENA